MLKHPLHGHWIHAVMILAALIAVGLLQATFSRHSVRQDALPSETLSVIQSRPTQPETSDASAPDASEEASSGPSESVPAVSLPTQSPLPLYTQEQLEAMDRECIGWGPGPLEGPEKLPAGSVAAHKKFQQYDAYFIGPYSKEIHLTFNLGDMWNGKDLSTGKVLDILKEKEIHATFFINSLYEEENSDTVRRIIGEGHILGNHGNHHFDMPKLSLEQMTAEIADLHTYILEKYGYRMNQFRPPSGYYSQQLLAVAQNLGYCTVQHSFAYRDWESGFPATAEQARRQMLSRLHPGAIYLLHTVSDANVAALSEVIDEMRLLGYRITPFIPK